MDFLRRHVFLIVCVVVAVGGVALIITGARAMPKVLEEMEKVEGIYRQLNSLQSQPVNLAQIEAARQRIELLLEDRAQVRRTAREEFYGFKPLVDGVLPNGDALKRNEFKRTYGAKMQSLLESLEYGAPPTRAEIAVWQERIESEEAERRESGTGLEGGLSEPSSVPEGPPLTLAGVLTPAGAVEDAAARASMNAAQKIYCYARRFDEYRPPDMVPSLEFWSEMEDTGTADAPDLWDIWHAQIGYWIQEDVVEAIVALNSEAAEEARKKEQHAWVGILPVKEVISVRISDSFVPRDGEEIFGPAPGGYDAALPPGTPETVFTHSGQSATYDVVQFTVKLVMDQRSIPLLIDLLSKDSFHTLLRVSYQAIPPNRRMVGKIYGSGPVVNVVMDFETVLLGDVFRRLLPRSVCEFHEIPCPEPEETGEGG